ncbi:hypothetical protein HPB51_013223 [Rhipicephalus microplus]|uniref:Uncharacterized protein n=1 Tax=Rhipicephalus microplus TaxID=6941 RepID=A0A9J6DMY1_RHIMP|nr:hypothetical protein HPB51_013223 [Rhipicephalus microplus]
MPKLAKPIQRFLMSSHAEQQSRSRCELEDRLEEPLAKVQDEDSCSSGDEMVCDPEPISVADSAAKDAVILFQCYFENDGGTEFLSSLSAMDSYYVRKCLKKAKQIITSFFPMADGNASITPDFGQASGRNGGASAARVTAVDQDEWQGGPASPDFSSSSEFPSLPVQDFPQRQSPSGISYSTALQQQKAPRTPAAPSGVTTNREIEELASPSAAGVNTRSSMQQQGRRGGGNNGGNSPHDVNNKHHKRSNWSRKHRRGGGGGGTSDGVRRAEDAEPSTRLQHHQQEKRGSRRSGGGKANAPTIDGGAEKHQFEAPEKDKSQLRHDTEAIGANVTREWFGSGRMPRQNGVRVNAARGRRETRHSSVFRGVLKGDGSRQHHQQGGRGGGSRKGSDSDRHLPVLEDGQREVDKPALRRSWNSGSPARQKHSVDEYPPLGSRGTGDSERSPDARMTKADTKDAMVKQGDNIPKQQPQTPFREKGSKPVKPLASTNGGSAGPKHKAAISMAIADIMVPKQRQPKKLKEKENLLERSSKKPEVARCGLVANRLDSSAPSKKRGKERETPARRKLSVMKKVGKRSSSSHLLNIVLSTTWSIESTCER